MNTLARILYGRITVIEYVKDQGEDTSHVESFVIHNEEEDQKYFIVVEPGGTVSVFLGMHGRFNVGNTITVKAVPYPRKSVCKNFTGGCWKAISAGPEKGPVGS